MARLVIAYVLWFFGGWVGLHHFYLKRDRHAFVWWATLGGAFGLGWVRDLWKLPDYVQECNRDEEWEREFTRRRSVDRKPSRSTSRFAGEIIMGNILGYLIRALLPEQYVDSTKLDLGFLLAVSLPQLGAAIGVHLVANIGRHKGSWSWAALGAYIGTPWLILNPDNVAVAPLMSAIFVQWKGVTWRTDPEPKQGLFRRVSKLTFYGTLYLALWGCVIYFNASITTKDGEEIPLREAIPNFFKSPAWAETKDSMHRLYNYFQAHGWRRIWDEIKETFDPVGEQNAYKVLGLSSSATQEEITHAYRKMSRQWHPDKQKDPQKKEEAQEKFIEIQQAYDILSSIKARRSAKNKQSSRPRKDEF
ncbi:dnaJ homolog subfamily C member 22-like [Haliotis cracherodii]|uniref:dnaJ homolog subfamily C member 22-like n=1 Tax=Haliotis cracherodii TaxID=6455 RepID=UPI0039E837DD